MPQLNTTADFPFGIWSRTCCITNLKNTSGKKTDPLSVTHLKPKHSGAIRNLMLWKRFLIYDWGFLNPKPQENTYNKKFIFDIMLSVLKFIHGRMLVRGQSKKKTNYNNRIISEWLTKEITQKFIQLWITVDTFVISDRQCEIKHTLKSNPSLRLH